ncbi:MAG: hypothetical protein E7576_17380 [Ruminococcaceae bacterium]|nr:hypothetical protein [Oscillospiraceae bacterium]
MFRVKEILFGFFRHGRRNILSCLLLAAVLSVAFCGLCFRSFALSERRAVSERYGGRVRLAFRNELQYDPAHPRFSALDVRLNGTSQTDGVPAVFFDPEAMAAYDHPYPASAELFDALGALPQCRDSAVAYAETAYGFSEDVPPDVQSVLNVLYGGMGAVPTKIMTEHIVVGGDLGAFTGIAREISSKGQYAFLLEEGAEPEPGKGECVITDFYARVYGIGVGDSLTLYAASGEELCTLTVSGICGVCVSEFYEAADPDAVRRGLRGGGVKRVTGSDPIGDFGGRPDVGTPFDRLCEDPEGQEMMRTLDRDAYWVVSEAMLGVIHTDFETAYNLYGTPGALGTGGDSEDRHHINRFFACFDLEGPESAEAFGRAALNLLPESWRDEFAVYPFENSRALFVRPPETLLATAETMVRLAGSLTALFILLAAAVLIRENGREIGICLGVGLSERDVAGRMAGECAVLMALSLLAASFCDPLVRRFLARGYPYLETVGPIPAVNVFGGGTLLFGLAAAAFGVGLTAALTSLYIRVRSPIRLIRQGEE